MIGTIYNVYFLFTYYKNDNLYILINYIYLMDKCNTFDVHEYKGF